LVAVPVTVCGSPEVFEKEGSTCTVSPGSRTPLTLETLPGTVRASTAIGTAAG
jgi:hypothetical protein